MTSDSRGWGLYGGDGSLARGGYSEHYLPPGAAGEGVGLFAHSHTSFMSKIIRLKYKRLIQITPLGAERYGRSPPQRNMMSAGVPPSLTSLTVPQVSSNTQGPGEMPEVKGSLEGD